MYTFRAAALKFPLNSDIVPRRSLPRGQGGSFAALMLFIAVRSVRQRVYGSPPVPGRRGPRPARADPVSGRRYARGSLKRSTGRGVIEPLIARVAQRGRRHCAVLRAPFRRLSRASNAAAASTFLGWRRRRRLFAKRTMHGKSNSLKRRILIAPRWIAVISVKRPALRHPFPPAGPCCKSR